MGHTYRYPHGVSLNRKAQSRYIREAPASIEGEMKLKAEEQNEVKGNIDADFSCNAML